MRLEEAARQYAELGWALVALDGKNPKGHGWQKTLPLDPDDAADIWSRRSGDNMGLVLGPSGVIDFELDEGDDRKFWELAGSWYDSNGGAFPDTPCYVTGTGKPHVLFRDPGGLSRRTRDGMELRAGPHQSVIPPSIHPETGKPYEWIQHPKDYPLADPPQALLDFFAGRGTSNDESHWRTPLAVGKLGLGEGRHASMVSFLGKMVNVLDSPEQLVAAALTYADLTQDPPYPESTITSQALDIWARYREEPDSELDEASKYLGIRSLDKIQMRTVEFLWHPYLQRAAFHLLVGKKGAGKGSLLAYFAARMTRGLLDSEPRSVLWVSGEDSFSIDIKPRIVAQDGDPNRVFAVEKHIHLPSDIPHLKSVCQEREVGLVVFDPVVSFLGNADVNSESAIIQAIGGLNLMADELDLCVVGVRHLSKTADRGVLDSVLGSVCWVNSPRAVLGLQQNNANKHVQLEILASNRVRTWGQFSDFTMGQVSVDGVDVLVPKIVPMQG